ncbi:MAG: cytochrome c peroxidase [Pseudomonadota bacterium]
MKLPGYIFFACMLLAATAAATEKTADPLLRPAEVPFPADNKPTAARVELGKMLFFDPRLSGSRWISCATCHNPALAWSDGLPTMLGHGMQQGRRSTPTILNTAYNNVQFWDGRAATLEAQALGPIEAEGEMHQKADELPDRLMAIEGYRRAFARAYPDEKISKLTIAKALASFERTIVSTESPFDRWRRGDKKALSASAQRGFSLFTGRANCMACHQGFNFDDDGFHNIGLPLSGGDEDVGRFAHRKVKVNKGAFKTPTLRDVALTAPYMHNGVYKSLQEVVEHYNKGGVTHENLDPNIRPLNLSDQDQADIVAFLQSLTGKPMKVVLPHLPVGR